MELRELQPSITVRLLSKYSHPDVKSSLISKVFYSAKYSLAITSEHDSRILTLVILDASRAVFSNLQYSKASWLSTPPMPALVSLPSAPTLAFGKNNSWLQNTFTRPIGLSCLTHSILKSILARLLFSYVLVKEVNQIKSFDWRSDSVIKSILRLSNGTSVLPI